MKAAFHTLGCKVNQYDTEAMLESFERAGYEIVPFSEEADVYLINTCTVTGTGDQKSLKLMRRVAREHPSARHYRRGLPRPAGGAGSAANGQRAPGHRRTAPRGSGLPVRAGAFLRPAHQRRCAAEGRVL